MQKQFKFIGIILSFLLLVVPFTSFAQFGDIFKATFYVDVEGTVGDTSDDVMVQVGVKCYQDPVGVGDFLVELVPNYTNNSSQTLAIDSIATAGGTDYISNKAPGGATVTSGGGIGNSQIFTGLTSFSGTVTTEVVGTATSETSEVFTTECSPTAVSLSSVSASTASINWVIAAAALLLGLATAVVWQRRQHA